MSPKTDVTLCLKAETYVTSKTTSGNGLSASWSGPAYPRSLVLPKRTQFAICDWLVAIVYIAFYTSSNLSGLLSLSYIIYDNVFDVSQYQH